MAFRRRRKFRFRTRRRRYFRRNRFNFRRYLRRSAKKPEIKYVNKVYNTNINANSTYLNNLVNEITEGTGPSQRIGRYVKSRYLSINLNFMVNAVGSGSPVTRLRICVLTPRCDQVQFEGHVTAVGSLGQFDPSLAGVMYDNIIYINNPADGWRNNFKLKRTFRFPRKIQFSGLDNAIDNRDFCYIAVYNPVASAGQISIYGHARLTYCDA